MAKQFFTFFAAGLNLSSPICEHLGHDSMPPDSLDACKPDKFGHRPDV
jgi:hypothetical protein